MRFLKYFLYATKILWKNKLRTSLSTLGIVIWIASVTIMLALWEWLKQQMLENLSVSNDVITITPNEWWNGGEVVIPWVWKMQTWDNGTPTNPSIIRVKEIFTQDTIDKIKKYIPNVKTVLATWNAYWWETNFEWKTIYSSIVWVTQDYFKTKNIKIVSGYWFTSKDFKNNSKVAILWNDLVKYDLEWKNPIWKTIMLGWYAYTVIWILDKSNDWNVNYAISIPMTTLQSSFWVSKFQNLAIYVNDILKIEDTKKNVLYLLFKLSEVFSPSEVKFRLESNDEAIKYIDETVKQMKLFLVWIASIALLVWWIWIMNIMFVSVVERTKEIWIRKAIWAKRKDILMQFLAESVVISILWCILALLVSIVWIYFINKYSPMPAVFSINVLLTASLVSVSMWIIFWIVPAWKASKLKPIDALRFE